MKQSFFLIVILCVGLSFNSMSQAASLESRVDQDQISQNETVTLTLTYDDIVSGSVLDLSPLKKDFDVLSSSPQTSNSVSIINGVTKRQASTKWSITLVPLRQGNLTIPALEINGQRSRVINVKVSPSSASASRPQPIDVKITVNKKSAVLGEQILLLIRLTAAPNVSNLQAEALQVDGANLFFYDEKNTQVTNNGVNRQVIERYYAIFPEKEGEISIPIQRFTGVTGARRSFFGSSGGKRIGARSQAITINVDPTPATLGHGWFPADKVFINSKWSSDTAKIRVGEPVTRTVTVQAIGQLASAIPPLKQDDSTAYKSYNDQPKLENQLYRKGLAGIREESQAIIPSSSGVLTLPEQTIHWWNTNAKQWQESTLAAETITVLPSLNTEASEQINPINNNTQTISSKLNEPAESKTSLFWKISALSLALLCVLQFFFMYKLKAKKPSVVTEGPIKADNEKKTWAKLQNSLKAKDAVNTRKHLLNWARLSTASKKISNLQMLATETQDEKLTEMLQSLDRHLFKSDEPIDWSQLGEKLLSFRKQLLNPQKEAKQALKSLYPS